MPQASGDPQQRVLSVSIVALFATLVFGYSFFKTKTGQWAHVDASVKSERRELNIVAGLGLLVGAVVLALFKAHIDIVLAVSLSGAIVLVGHFLSKVVKPSLHVGFAIFAACLTFPNSVAVILLLSFAVVIGWSRLHLKRHTRVDLIVGAGLGLVAGMSFQLVVSTM